MFARDTEEVTEGLVAGVVSRILLVSHVLLSNLTQ